MAAAMLMTTVMTVSWTVEGLDDVDNEADGADDDDDVVGYKAEDFDESLSLSPGPSIEKRHIDK